MSFLKNRSAGFYAGALTLIAGAVGLGFYLVNCNTAYFRNLGTSPIVVGCAVAAIVAELLYLALRGVAADLMPVISGVCLMSALGTFLSSRINGIAAIMTFTNNAKNMADLSSAIVGMVALLIAAILNIIAAFLAVNKE